MYFSLREISDLKFEKYLFLIFLFSYINLYIKNVCYSKYMTKI